MRLLIALLLLSACTASGANFESFSVPKSDRATVIIYRDNPFYALFATLSFQVNEKNVCALHNSSFYIQQNIEGPITISASTWDLPGTSILTFNTKPKEVYYVKMNVNSEKQIIGGISGMAGTLISEKSSTIKGPYIFTLMDSNMAKNELSNLKRDCI